jgi:hypothetical protein
VDGYITIWRVSDGEEVWQSDGDAGATVDLQFAPDSKSLTAGYIDGNVKKYNLP